MKKYTRKLTRVGKRSLAIVIPADIVDQLNLRACPPKLYTKEEEAEINPP